MYNFNIVYPTPDSERDAQGTTIASQEIIISRADPQPGDADLEVNAFLADEAAVGQLKAIPGPVSGLPFDKFAIGKIGPQELRATLYFSNSNFYGLGIIDPNNTTTLGPFNATTRQVEVDFPVIVSRTLLVPDIPTQDPGTQAGDDNTVTQEEFLILKDQFPLTTWQIRTTHPTYTASDLSFITGQTNAFHLINGRVYKFKGASSVRQTGVSPLEYTYTYEWEIDPGTLARETSGTLAEPARIAEFVNPTLSLGSDSVTFSGSWWRPPFCKLLTTEDAVDVIVPTPGGTQTLQFQGRAVDYYWDGAGAFANAWQFLPGDPIGRVS
ncbi:MAG: hypothetical protein AAGB48_01880 [Planctomycetota bacterium]